MAGKAAYQCRCKANETVSFDQLIKIYAEQLHSNAQVVPEVEMLCHFDHMMLFLSIPFAQVVKNLDLHQSLVVESLLVPDNLDRN